MKHRIVVLGAGSAGAYVAGNLARRLSPADIEAPQLADVFAGTGIRLRLDRVTAVDAERQVAPIAAAGGLEFTEDGRIVVDRTMWSVSHPNVYAVGDNGRPLPVSCASTGCTGMQAMEAIVGDLTGRKIANMKLDHSGNHISLGRRDGILHMVDDEAQEKPKFMGGRKAARIKAGILKMSLWTTSHPTFGLPKRRRRLAATLDTSAEKAVAQPPDI
ncbi:hypothetical protein QQY66_47005 [Streptomyces sp. DG2A-72]|uniref:hypothetical protein n=1 Tax=Streptomyces sp. DG2A-72 TaxID=3051386 RepID=UPI00265C3EF8|nr:hypothetical protein [Streptomyces sp. DG2A-72]MDO0938904.1 hypothetical protein [Streptomyces sp. DG2A-72]